MTGAPAPRHPALARPDERPWTWANLVTIVRAIACVAIFGYAFHAGDETWSFIGLGVYWALDVVDGFLARRLDQETRLGAQLDILADRLLVTLFYVTYVALHPELVVAVLLFLVQFLGVDHYLSNQFLRWPLKSPNYFHVVDRTIWRLNWSIPGKLLNTAVVTLVLVGTRSAWAGGAIAAAILVVKLYSCVRLHRLPPPEVGWAPPPGAVA